ncbi:MAG TPA: hypothetical protein VK130_02515 [Steroidobacteraceae bacterium]|nr:hypothetical protein [Steroidobacteraceae bacterium]
MNKPSRRRWLALLALCAFSLHAAVPMGFMIGVSGGQARLVLCPGVAPVQSVAAHSMAGAPMSGMVHVGGHAAASGSSCAFALAGAAALMLPAPAPVLPFDIRLQQVRSAVMLSLPAEPPPRYLAPRGPPALV